LVLHGVEGGATTKEGAVSGAKANCSSSGRVVRRSLPARRSTNARRLRPPPVYASQLINIEMTAATFELDPRDCLALADACGYAINRNIPGDHYLLAALRAALTAGAMAGFALDWGAVEEDAYTLAGLREFSAPADGHHIDGRKVLAPSK
jgi:hypothetical protein